MSGFGTFSHIYQDEPADPLPLQPPLLFSLLSQVLEGFAAAPALTQTSSDSKLTLKLQTLHLISQEIETLEGNT